MIVKSNFKGPRKLKPLQKFEILCAAIDRKIASRVYTLEYSIPSRTCIFQFQVQPFSFYLFSRYLLYLTLFSNSRLMLNEIAQETLLIFLALREPICFSVEGFHILHHWLLGMGVHETVTLNDMPESDAISFCNIKRYTYIIEKFNKFFSISDKKQKS